MDYIAVYDGEEPETGSSQLKISVDKVQKLGVRSEPAAMRVLDKVVKAVAASRSTSGASSPSRRVRRLGGEAVRHATGQPVTKGQPLFEVYSPNWCRRSASTRSPSRRSRRSRTPATIRKPA